MRHAVLGAGGVGGLLAAALSRAGGDVVLVMRPESLARYPGQLTVRSRVLGDFSVQIAAAATLDRPVDVVWITVKATALSAALALVTPKQVADAAVIPLMNGIDHVVKLRARYRYVVAGTMRVESERLAGWHIEQRSPFMRVDLAGADAVATELRAAGVECHVSNDELQLLWQKLAFLAPLALATTAADAPLGQVRDDTRYVAAQRESVAVAQAVGARIDLDSLQAAQSAAPDTMRSSMQRDVDQGLVPELDAIAGPILRGGQLHDIETPATQYFVDQIRARAAHLQASSLGDVS